MFTPLDRFLLCFKNCSGTVWTGVRAFFVEKLPLFKSFHTIPNQRMKWSSAKCTLDSGSVHIYLETLVLEKSWVSVAICAPTKAFRLGPDRFKNLSDTGHPSFNSRAKQSFSGPKIAPEVAFPVWEEALSDTHFALWVPYFTVRYIMWTPP